MFRYVVLTTLQYVVYNKFMFRKDQLMFAKQMFLSDIFILEDGVG